EILVACRHARAPLATAILGAIGRKRHALDVTGVAHGYDHVFAGDQVLVVEIGDVIGDFGPARTAELVTDLFKLFPNDLLHALTAAQDIEIVLDLGAEAIEFVADFVTAKS